MYPVAHIVSDVGSKYNTDDWLTRIKERFATGITGESFIKELGLRICEVAVPPNFNEAAYSRNLQLAVRKVGRANVYMAPGTLRLYDFKYYSSFQKRIFAYSVINSIQLLLRMHNTSIKSSCLAIYDASDEINKEIIFEAAKNCRYIILVSQNMDKLNKMCNYIINEYGTSPVITNDMFYSFKEADFIITSRKLVLDRDIFVWHIDNSYDGEIRRQKSINNVAYSVPWNSGYDTMPPELMGAILCQIAGKRNIEEAIKYNGIYIDSITYNGRTLDL